MIKLDVTPHIKPNNKIAVFLTVHKDTPTADALNGQTGVDTTSLTTQVLVSSGETVVLGGIYNHTNQNIEKRIPFFADIPFIGKLFKNKKIYQTKKEVLIFLTPKIV